MPTSTVIIVANFDVDPCRSSYTRFGVPPAEEDQPRLGAYAACAFSSLAAPLGSSTLLASRWPPLTRQLVSRPFHEAHGLQ